MQSQSMRSLLLLAAALLAISLQVEAGGFTTVDSTHSARLFHTTTLLPSGKVLVAGGLSSLSGAPLSTCELYDPATGTWTTTGPLSVSRAFHAAILLTNGTVLVSGGVSSSDIPLTSAEIYNPSTGTWTPTNSMVTARSTHTMTLLEDGRVLATAGGVTNSEIYSPSSGTWALTGNILFSVQPIRPRHCCLTARSCWPVAWAGPAPKPIAKSSIPRRACGQTPARSTPPANITAQC